MFSLYYNGWKDPKTIKIPTFEEKQQGTLDSPIEKVANPARYNLHKNYELHLLHLT